MDPSLVQNLMMLRAMQMRKDPSMMSPPPQQPGQGGFTTPPTPGLGGFTPSEGTPMGGFTTPQLPGMQESYPGLMEKTRPYTSEEYPDDPPLKRRPDLDSLRRDRQRLLDELDVLDGLIASSTSDAEKKDLLKQKKEKAAEAWKNMEREQKLKLKMDQFPGDYGTAAEIKKQREEEQKLEDKKEAEDAAFKELAKKYDKIRRKRAHFDENMTGPAMPTQPLPDEMDSEGWRKWGEKKGL